MERLMSAMSAVAWERGDDSMSRKSRRHQPAAAVAAWRNKAGNALITARPGEAAERRWP